MLSTHHFPPESIISQCFSTCCIEICLRKYVICCRYVLYTRYTPDSVRLVPLVLSARRILLTRDSLHLQKLNWFRFVCTFPLLPFAAKSKQKQNNPIYTSFFAPLIRTPLNAKLTHLPFIFSFFILFVWFDRNKRKQANKKIPQLLRVFNFIQSIFSVYSNISCRINLIRSHCVLHLLRETREKKRNEGRFTWFRLRVHVGA